MKNNLKQLFITEYDEYKNKHNILVVLGVVGVSLLIYNLFLIGLLPDFSVAIRLGTVGVWLVFYVIYAGINRDYLNFDENVLLKPECIREFYKHYKVAHEDLGKKYFDSVPTSFAYGLVILAIIGVGYALLGVLATNESMKLFRSFIGIIGIGLLMLFAVVHIFGYQKLERKIDAELVENNKELYEKCLKEIK